MLHLINVWAPGGGNQFLYVKQLDSVRIFIKATFDFQQHATHHKEKHLSGADCFFHFFFQPAEPNQIQAYMCQGWSTPYIRHPTWKMTVGSSLPGY